ncbi:LamG-like jellyroll fold domain-containing protein [Mangrovimonas sp. DI 80]|uniref:LamG-like jellyroll fold domain-containing protein n=1 Tax=Mangrovimonas sp. DI 80 TaxID=1779330 RepID=UPI000F4EC695|nr:LamG-like jellyroll fold domain-containing protein [Mangrovimonas sp. DI 80]
MIKQLHRKIAVSALMAGSFLIGNAQTGIHFDGEDDYIQGNTVPVQGTDPRTIEAWIKTTKNSTAYNADTNPTGEGQSVICDWGKESKGNRFTFNILPNNALRLEVNGGGVNGVKSVNDGLWHHVAVVFESSTSTNHSVKFYVDGKLDAETTLAKYAYTSSYGEKLKIGVRVDGVNFFRGGMDELRIWNKVLSLEELKSRMYTELCGDETGLVAYYPFNEGIPDADNSGVSTTADGSPTADTGTLKNFALTGTTSNWVTGRSLVSVEDNTLSANQEEASYQWLDCANANTAIEGANGQTFTPEASGTYAVEVTVGTCVTTSECVTVDINALGLEENLMDTLKVFPNPTSGNLNVALNSVYQSVEAQLVSITGKVVGQYQFNNTNEFQIELSQFNSGVYFLNLKADQLDAVTIKVVKM